MFEPTHLYDLDLFSFKEHTILAPKLPVTSTPTQSVGPNFPTQLASLAQPTLGRRVLMPRGGCRAMPRGESTGVVVGVDNI